MTVTQALFIGFWLGGFALWMMVVPKKGDSFADSVVNILLGFLWFAVYPLRAIKRRLLST